MHETIFKSITKFSVEFIVFEKADTDLKFVSVDGDAPEGFFVNK